MDKLDGLIRHYTWGDRRIIADLQRRARSDEPEAELWLGAHPTAPSTMAGTTRSLLDEVSEHPEELLGPEVHRRFGRFPFLLKLLAAAEPLSIQAHPDLATAQAGYAREEAAGVPRDSPARTYRDDNHKPELICALTDFEAKCGFRDLAATRSLVDALVAAHPDHAASGDGSDDGPCLAELSRRLNTGGAPHDVLAHVLAWLLRLSRPEAARLVADTVAAADRLMSVGLSPRVAPHEAELRWTAELDRYHPGDRGVVVALLLNHVVLQPGEALFLGAGNLHAYLRGAGVELMANSDNVVRGGLTVKHVDVEELVAIVDTNPAPVAVQVPTGGAHRFRSPVPEFALARLVGVEPHRCEPEGPEIVLVTDGDAVIERLDRPGRLRLHQGEAALVAHGDGPYRIEPAGPATVWRATVGSQVD